MHRAALNSFTHLTAVSFLIFFDRIIFWFLLSLYITSCINPLFTSQQGCAHVFNFPQFHGNALVYLCRFWDLLNTVIDIVKIYSLGICFLFSPDMKMFSNVVIFYVLCFPICLYCELQLYDKENGRKLLWSIGTELKITTRTNILVPVVFYVTNFSIWVQCLSYVISWDGKLVTDNES